MTSKRSALIIGINDYSNEIYPLNACVNDAIAMANFLKNDFNFSVRILATGDGFDGKPTRKNILAELDALSAFQKNDDDIVVIYYAGRASICVQNNLSESGRLETIVPCDSSRCFDGTPTDIYDVELKQKLFQINLKRTSNVVMLFDSCYFGRVPKCCGEKNFSNKHRMANALNPTHDDLLSKHVAQQLLVISKLPVVRPSCIVISASDYGETAWECNEYGYFTRALIMTLKTKSITYSNLVKSVKDILIGLKPLLPQNPIFEGTPAESKLFEQSSLSREREFKALLNNDGTIAIAGGKMHGVEINSIWNIYSVSKSDETSAKIVATAVCESVEDAFSILRFYTAPTTERNRFFTACCISLPSVERGRVFIDLADVELSHISDAFLKALSNSSMLRVVFEKKNAQWILRIDGSVLKNEQGDFIGEKDVAASITTIGGDALLVPVVKKDKWYTQQWVKWTVCNLEQLLNFERVLLIKPIQPLLTVQALLRSPRTIFVGKTEDAPVQVEIFNMSEKPLFAFFVKCNLDGSIEPSNAIQIDGGASVLQKVSLVQPFSVYEFSVFSIKMLSLKLILTEEENVSLDGLKQSAFRMPLAQERGKGHTEKKTAMSSWAAFEFFIEAHYKHQIRSVNDAKVIEDIVPLQFELICNSNLSRNFMLKCLQTPTEEEKSIYKEQSGPLQFVRDNYCLVDETATPVVFKLVDVSKANSSNEKSSVIQYNGPASRLALAKRANEDENCDAKKRRI